MTGNWKSTTGDWRRVAAGLVVLWAGLCAGCGPGKFGSSVEVTLGAGVADPASEWSVDQKRLVLSSGLVLEVTRACLSITGGGEEPASVTVLPAETMVAVQRFAPPGGVAKEDCVCHGNPPHCHGDCGDAHSESGLSGQPVSTGQATVVDLADPAGLVILRSGAAPGEYNQILMTLGPAADAASFPAACSDMTGRTFFLEGVLVNETSGDATDVVVDLREDTRITDVLAADHGAHAETGKAGRLRVTLLLDNVFSSVDWAQLAFGAGFPLVVGGEGSDHPEAASAIMDALLSHENVLVEPAL